MTLKHLSLLALLILAACTPVQPQAAREAVPPAARMTPPPAVAGCYDADRGVVTHVAAGLCQGEVIDAEREAALHAERARRIEAAVAGRRADAITGNLRLAGTGSGFFIGATGELLTNNHVIDHCELLTATPEGGAKMPLALVASDAQRDIALFRAPSTPLAFARFSAAPREVDGRGLVVAGYPAYGLPTIHPSVVHVSAMALLLATTDDEVIFEGSIRRGHSGSPLLDGAGHVIGIVRAKPDVPKIFKTTGKVVGDYGIAISQAATLRFLAQHGVRPLLASAGPDLPTAELEAAMRSFVAQIGCWR
jgi:S1-C subfamily serine protease